MPKSEHQCENEHENEGENERECDSIIHKFQITERSLLSHPQPEMAMLQTMPRFSMKILKMKLRKN